MLQLRHVFLGRRFFRERPRQHELGLEDRPGRFDPAIQGGRHPAQRWMPDLVLDIREDLAGIGLIPASVQLLGRDAELDHEIARQVLGLDLAPLLPPQPEEGSFVVAHDDPGVRATDEVAASARLSSNRPCLWIGSRSRLGSARELR